MAIQLHIMIYFLQSLLVLFQLISYIQSSVVFGLNFYMTPESLFQTSSTSNHHENL